MFVAALVTQGRAGARSVAMHAIMTLHAAPKTKPSSQQLHFLTAVLHFLTAVLWTCAWPY
jgi:hypothetical protein